MFRRMIKSDAMDSQPTRSSVLGAGGPFYLFRHVCWLSYEREGTGVEVEQRLSVEEEVALLSRGAEDIFPEGELINKVRQAREEGRPLRVKLGVDPTATDLHLGHLIPVLKLRQFQDLGHQAVLIIGDYTATVGDPSGRNKARPQLTHEEVLENAKTYTDQLFRILDGSKTEVHFNGDWFSKMSFQEVIQLLSRMTLARMLEREDFANRMREQSPISLHELVYPLMQGYDSAMVRADIELGGTDQKFNILVGRDIQREFGQSPQVGICNPILIGTDGTEKMSKSLGNTIGLNDSPNEMFGKTMSIPDELMRLYFEQITPVSLAEIDELLDGIQAGTHHPRDIKRRLAMEVVRRFHGDDAANKAAQEFDRVFAQQELPEDMPEVVLDQASLDDGRIWIIRLIVKAQFASSNAEARRLVQQGAVKIDDETITDDAYDWPAQSNAVLRVGRRRFARILLDD